MSKKKKSEKQNKARHNKIHFVEILMVVITLAIIGVAGYFVALHINKKPTSSSISSSSPTSQKSSNASSTTTNTSTSKNTTTSPKTSTSPSTKVSYLVISELGVKVKMGSADANLIEYNLSGPTDGATGSLTASAGLQLKPSVTTNQHCQTLGFEIDQGLVSSYTGSGTPPNVVGKYYYTVTGTQFTCGIPNIDSIRSNYTTNTDSWTFFASS